MRITRTTHDDSATVVVDGASSGRGAWLCRGDDGRVSTECVDAAVRSKQFARAWRTAVDDHDIEAIRRAIDHGSSESTEE